MDRLLRRVLKEITRDRRSGAAELALRGVAALQAWLHRHRQPTEQELLEVARALLCVQPSMAPLLRLANEVALAADAEVPAKTLMNSLVEFRRLLRTAPNAIAERFRRALQGKRPRQIVIYSYSSTVVNALIRAKSRIDCVYCSEGRPAYEGRDAAEKLARAGIQVWFETDAALLEEVAIGQNVIVLGADAVLFRGFVNKVGTNAIVPLALQAGAPVWILADTSKFWPESPFQSNLWMGTYGHPGEIWKEAPRRVRVWNPYFEVAKFFGRMRFLTERRSEERRVGKECRL